MIGTSVGDVLTLSARLMQELPAASDGELWRPAGTSRQLDAHLIRLPAGQRDDCQAESEVDVLINVVGGSGVLESGGAAEGLAAGHLLWLPRGAHRAISAGSDGLVYVRVHRRRAGLAVNRPAIDRADGAQGGEPPCMISRLCPDCDRPTTERDARFCAGCGGRLPV
ncbi:MAG TPA: hypothetical protein VFH94_06600 [Streptomyces sp.]|nr:hypothetical protein [Streptomyces sp.]